METKKCNCGKVLPEWQVAEYWESQGNTSLMCSECEEELSRMVCDSMIADGSSRFDPCFPHDKYENNPNWGLENEKGE